MVKAKVIDMAEHSSKSPQRLRQQERHQLIRHGLWNHSHLELHSQQAQCGGAGQDGGVGPQQACQRRPTVPEEQGVPGKEAGAEVRFTHQDGDLYRRHQSSSSKGQVENRFVPPCFLHLHTD